ncbi:MAG: type IV secretion protein Rhs, partial [Cyanobacteria bacterium P01_H01_bin.150]
KGASKAGIKIETAGGHKFQFNDSDGSVEIQSNGGHQIKMADSGPLGPTLSISSMGNLVFQANTAIFTSRPILPIPPTVPPGFP